MKDRINKIAQCLLEQEIVIASWGISSVSMLDNAISFHVAGLRYSGEVIISPISETLLCHVSFLENSQSYDIDYQQLVARLDELIEKTDNYQDDLKKWIHAHNNQ